MEDTSLQMLLAFFKALADESRLKLLGILAQGERSVDELAAILGLKEPTVSHHLAKLREIGLVSMTPDGNRRRYRLERGALHRLSRELAKEDTVASVAAENAPDAWERKVFEAFMEGDRITQIPRSLKKRMVLVRWLAQKFEPERRYKEKQVNELIKRHHEDFAYFRREMVESRLMARQAGVYWRLPDPPGGGEHGPPGPPEGSARRASGGRARSTKVEKA